FCGVEKSTETHQLVFDGTNGFVGDMITEDGDRCAEMIADVLCRDIMCGVFVDQREWVIYGEAQQLDVIEAVVEWVIGKQRKGELHRRTEEERLADSAIRGAVGAQLFLQKVAFPEQLLLAPAGKPQGPYPDQQFQLFGADRRSLDEIREAIKQSAPLTV